MNHVLRLADEKPATETRRKYCGACGSLIPYEAAYCPNCGAPQEAQAVTPEMMPRRRITETIAKKGRRIRLALFFMSLGIFVTMFLLGSTAALSPQEAQEIEKELMDIYGRDPSATFILRNNLTLCLLFFVPAFGTAFMAFVGYSTGTVLSALAIVSSGSTDAFFLALATLSLPWSWMEFIAYSLASSEGMMIILALVGRTLRREAKTLLIVMAVSVALLVLGAIAEAWFIHSAMAG